MVALSECVEHLSDTPNGLALLNAWQVWRGSELLPITDKVQPERLGAAINSVTVIEVHSRDDSTYRLVAQQHSDFTRRDLKGKSVKDITPPADRKNRMERLWSIASTPCGVIVTLTYTRPSGISEKARRFLLPVKPRLADEPMRLYSALDRIGGKGVQDIQPVELVAASDEYSYVDIGYGVPK
jgi:hypothetical protein